MSSFADQVFKVAADAARLARMMSPQRDVLGDVAQHLRAAGLAVTHCGHQAFRAANVGFSGAEPFQLEDALVRVADDGVVIEPEDVLRWFAVNMALPPGQDAIVTLDLSTDQASAVNAFIRCRFTDGRHLDGVRMPLGFGDTDRDQYVPHPVVDDEEEYTSHLFFTIDLFSGVTIRSLGVVAIPATPDDRPARTQAAEV